MSLTYDSISSLRHHQRLITVVNYVSMVTTKGGVEKKPTGKLQNNLLVCMDFLVGVVDFVLFFESDSPMKKCLSTLTTFNFFQDRLFTHHHHRTQVGRLVPIKEGVTPRSNRKRWMHSGYSVFYHHI